MKSKKTVLAFALMLSFLPAACSKQPVSIAAKWHLISYGNGSQQILADPNVTTYIHISENGKIDGNVGCNNFNLTYEISDNKIKFGPINATKMVCRNVASQESTVFSIISDKELIFELNKNLLQIHSVDGQSIVILERTN